MQSVLLIFWESFKNIFVIWENRKFPTSVFSIQFGCNLAGGLISAKKNLEWGIYILMYSLLYCCINIWKTKNKKYSRMPPEKLQDRADFYCIVVPSHSIKRRFFSMVGRNTGPLGLRKHWCGSGCWEWKHQKRLFFMEAEADVVKIEWMEAEAMKKAKSDATKIPLI